MKRQAKVYCHMHGGPIIGSKGKCNKPTISGKCKRTLVTYKKWNVCGFCGGTGVKEVKK